MFNREQHWAPHLLRSSLTVTKDMFFLYIFVLEHYENIGTRAVAKDVNFVETMLFQYDDKQYRSRYHSYRPGF